LFVKPICAGTPPNEKNRLKPMRRRRRGPIFPARRRRTKNNRLRALRGTPQRNSAGFFSKRAKLVLVERKKSPLKPFFVFSQNINIFSDKSIENAQFLMKNGKTVDLS
jgi:hypothetical protein